MFFWERAVRNGENGRYVVSGYEHPMRQSPHLRFMAHDKPFKDFDASTAYLMSSAWPSILSLRFIFNR